MAMDFISGPTTTTNAATAAAAAAAATIPRSPDSDTDTPPHPPPSKRAHQHHQVISSDNNSTVHVSYKECLKNHAASIGGHALDGCCEFMPGPTMNPMDPTSLTCAACGCHRNFHRRDPDDPTPLHHLIPPSAVARKPHSPPSASHLLLSLSGHTHSPSAPSDHDVIHTPAAVTSANNGTSAPAAAVMGFYNNNGGGGGGANSGGQNGNFQSRKRFRTKFTQEQKEKMYEFSEKIGWKLKKGEEKLVEDFCKQVGVDRTVFKVWMHNNKHSSSTSATTTPTPTPTPTTATPLTPISSSLNKLHKTTTSSSTTTPTTTNFNGSLEEKTNNNSSSNNNNNSGNVGMNCGGMLGVGSAHLDFNFANAGAQEAKAQ